MSVLEADPPRFSPDEAEEIAAELFGLSGRAVALGSERDQAFLIDDGAGGGGTLTDTDLRLVPRAPRPVSSIARSVTA